MVASVATWEVQRRLYRMNLLRAFALVNYDAVPPVRIVLAVLPIVFLCAIVATTILWRLGFKESWL